MELPKRAYGLRAGILPEDMLLAENLPYTVEQGPRRTEHRFIIEGTEDRENARLH